VFGEYRKLKNNQLFISNLLSMLSGNFGKIIIQTFFFFLFARIIGVKEFGAFSAIFSLISIASPFSGLGYGNILIKEVSLNKRTITINFYNSILVLIICSSILTFFLSLVSYLMFSSFISLYFLILLCCCELFFQRLLELFSQCYIGLSKMKRTGIIYIFQSISRLLPVFFLLNIGHDKLDVWVSLYFTFLLISIFYCIIQLKKYIKSPRFNFSKMKTDLKDSIYFSIGLASQSIYNDIDKTLLGKFGTLEYTGLYSMAYKLIDVVFIPAKALLGTTYPQFFKLGNVGIKATISLAAKIISILIIYSLLAVILLMVLFKYIISLLGEQYKGIGDILKWIIVIPILRSIHYPIADAITGSGYQKYRSFVQIFIAIGNALFTIIFIIYFNQTYVIGVSVISDVALMLLLGAFYLFLIVRSKK